MLSRQIYIEFTEQRLSVLKFKELLKEPALFSSSLSVQLSDRDEMWFEKDVVKDDTAKMCFNKHFYYAPWCYYAQGPLPSHDVNMNT